MTPQDLVALRARWGLTQAQLAERLGMTTRAYQALEAGDSAIRNIHVLAIDHLSMEIVAAHGDQSLATRDALRLLDRLEYALRPVNVRSVGGRSHTRVSRSEVPFLRHDLLVEDRDGKLGGETDVETYLRDNDYWDNKPWTP